MTDYLQQLFNEIPEAWQLDSESATPSELIGPMLDLLGLMVGRLIDAEKKIAELQKFDRKYM